MIAGYSRRVDRDKQRSPKICNESSVIILRPYSAEEKALIATCVVRICHSDFSRFNLDKELSLDDITRKNAFTLAFNRNGPFFSIMHKVFNKITVCEFNSFKCDASERRCSVARAFAQQYNVVKSLGSSLNEILMCSNADDFMQDLLEFERLKQLKLNFPFWTGRKLQIEADLVQQLLNKHAHSLETLTNHANTKHVKTASVIQFNDKFPCLRSLKLVGSPTWVQTVCVSQGIGESVAELTLYFRMDSEFDNWKTFFEAIRLKWTKLHRIIIHSFPRNNNIPPNEMENLFISFGHQLRVIDYPGFSLSCGDNEDESSIDFSRIVSHCPNLELYVDARPKYEYHDYSRIHHLAPNVTNMKIDGVSDEDMEAFKGFASGLKI